MILHSPPWACSREGANGGEDHQALHDAYPEWLVRTRNHNRLIRTLAQAGQPLTRPGDLPRLLAELRQPLRRQQQARITRAQGEEDGRWIYRLNVHGY